MYSIGNCESFSASDGSGVSKSNTVNIDKNELRSIFVLQIYFSGGKSPLFCLYCPFPVSQKGVSQLSTLHIRNPACGAVRSMAPGCANLSHAAFTSIQKAIHTFCQNMDRFYLFSLTTFPLQRQWRFTITCYFSFCGESGRLRQCLLPEHRRRQECRTVPFPCPPFEMPRAPLIPLRVPV